MEEAEIKILPLKSCLPVQAAINLCLTWFAKHETQKKIGFGRDPFNLYLSDYKMKGLGKDLQAETKGRENMREWKRWWSRQTCQ